VNITPEQLDVFWLEESIWMASAQMDLPSYDFAFDTYFACRRPYHRPEKITAIARFGAASNYLELYQQLEAEGINLIHSPEQYVLASELPRWYPLISDLTPRSLWFQNPPTAHELEHEFDYPIFVKGSRQTSRHKAALSIINSSAEYEQMLKHYHNDPILHWQALVCREFVPLRPVPALASDTIPPSFEFRTFWWHGQCVGAGSYWSAFSDYSWSSLEQQQALKIAREAAIRVNLPFLVIDIAQTINGNWIVIECNDAQESGYAGVNALGMWQNIVQIEREGRSTAIWKYHF
jgi:ATP-grasp domain, R2K clade family 3